MNHSNERIVKQIKRFFFLLLQQMSSSSFFDLCPDILLNLFEYFSLNELFDIFIDLIPYLSILLNESHMRFSIDQNATENFWKEILPEINSNQILAIKNPYFLTNLSIFSSLQSIHLNLQSSSIFHQFQYLIHLKQLSIQLSEIIIEEQTWLSAVLNLPKLNQLKIDLTISKIVLIPQRPISIDKSIYVSNTIEYLEMKIPMSWRSLLVFLHHFPNLKIFRALLYRLNISHTSNVNLPILPSMKTLDLRGYFEYMSLIIPSITSTMPNLKSCRLIAMNLTNDDPFGIRSASIWKDLFKSCSNLIQVKVHMMMSIERNGYFENRVMKDLLRTFNNNSFCEKYHFQMEQLSINWGYVTLTGDYEKKKKSITKYSMDNRKHSFDSHRVVYGN
jgi:hypothetical protein